MDIGFKGISFPFRIDGRGGIATSSTSEDDYSHITESIQQIVGTALSSRVMNVLFGCEVNTMTFKNLEDSTQQGILKLYITEAVSKWDSRIKVQNINISQKVDSGTGERYTQVDVYIYVTKYLKSYIVTTTVGMGAK